MFAATSAFTPPNVIVEIWFWVTKNELILFGLEGAQATSTLVALVTSYTISTSTPGLLLQICWLSSIPAWMVIVDSGLTVILPTASSGSQTEPVVLIVNG